MECLLIFIAILVVLALLSGVGLTQSGRPRRLLAAYQQLARRFGGRCQRPGWFAYPRTEFTYRSVHVQVRVTSAATQAVGRKYATQLSMAMPDLGILCEIRHPRLPSVHQLPAGMRDLYVGSADFLKNYTVRGADAQCVTEILTDVVRWQIDRLRTTPTLCPLCIRFSQGRLTITKAKAYHYYPDLLEFVEQSLSLYDQVLLTRSRGIEFVEEETAHVLGEVVCKVCGEEICEDLVFCRRCKTPHHRECWQYNGGCCVFGCGETNFEMPRVAGHPPSPDD
jgi:hypothetical protein